MFIIGDGSFNGGGGVVGGGVVGGGDGSGSGTPVQGLKRERGGRR